MSFIAWFLKSISVFGVVVFNFSKDLAKFVYIFMEREDAAK